MTTSEVAAIPHLTKGQGSLGFSVNSMLCNSLKICGLHNIITAGNLADIKSEFTNFYINNENKIIENTYDPVTPSETKKNIATTIAIVGSQKRIGTTTQCFQIVKYLAAKGFKAAYLEFNNTDYLLKMKMLFSLSEDNFSFEGINMYSAKEVNHLLQKYDYIVYDYGSITDKNFNQYSFLEKNKCIIVCGATPSEIDYSTAALNLFNKNNNIIYLFNFVPEADETDIAALMGNHKVYFSTLIPDMFTVLNGQQKIYDNIIEIIDIPQTPKKDKKGLFRFRRKNNG